PVQPADPSARARRVLPQRTCDRPHPNRLGAGGTPPVGGPDRTAAASFPHPQRSESSRPPCVSFYSPPYRASTGNRSTTSVPFPSWLLIASCPPFCSTSRLAFVRPSPVPKSLVVKNGSKICLRCSGLIPHPVSTIRTTTVAGAPLLPSMLAVMVRVPPCGIASRALIRRFTSASFT